jgi:hypothetical protein
LDTNHGGGFDNLDPATRFIAPWEGDYYVKVKNKKNTIVGYTIIYYKEAPSGIYPAYLNDVGP